MTVAHEPIVGEVPVPAKVANLRTEKTLTAIHKLEYNICMRYINEQSDPDFASLSHSRYDIVTKDALKAFPEDILQAMLEQVDFKLIEFVEGEFTTVEVRRDVCSGE